MSEDGGASGATTKTRPSAARKHKGRSRRRRARFRKLLEERLGGDGVSFTAMRVVRWHLLLRGRWMRDTSKLRVCRHTSPSSLTRRSRRVCHMLQKPRHTHTLAAAHCLRRHCTVVPVCQACSAS